VGQTREPIMQALQARITGAIASSFTGNIANTGPGGVAQISAIADTSKLFAGLPAVGGTVPPGTLIQSIDSGSQITLTQPVGTPADGVTFLSGFQTVSRRVKSWNQDLAQPALFLTNVDDERQVREGFPPKRTMIVELRIYTDVAKNPDQAAGPVLNNFLDAIEAALQPQPGQEQMLNRVTLGGLCQHCWISGKSEFYPGDLGTQAKLLIPVSILIP